MNVSAPCLSSFTPPQCPNFGWCFQSSAGNFSCECRVGWAPPDCTQLQYTLWGYPNALSARWFYFSVYCVILLGASLFIAEHAYYQRSEATRSSPRNVAVQVLGLICVCLSCFFGALFWAINPNGTIYYPATIVGIMASDVFFDLCIGFIFCAYCVVTANWLSVATAVKTFRRRDGWPRGVAIAAITAMSVMIAACIVLGVINVYFYYAGVAIYIFVAVASLIMILTTLISGIIFLTNSNLTKTRTETRERYLRMARQLVILSVVVLLCIIFLACAASISASTLNSFTAFFLVREFFAQCSALTALIVITLYLRSAEWSRKFLRPVSPSGGSKTMRSEDTKSADTAHVDSSALDGITTATDSKSMADAEIERDFENAFSI